jgi:hypothetical protein
MSEMGGLEVGGVELMLAGVDTCVAYGLVGWGRGKGRGRMHCMDLVDCITLLFSVLSMHALPTLVYCVLLEACRAGRLMACGMSTGCW